MDIRAEHSQWAWDLGSTINAGMLALTAVMAAASVVAVFQTRKNKRAAADEAETARTSAIAAATSASAAQQQARAAERQAEMAALAVKAASEQAAAADRSARATEALVDLKRRELDASTAQLVAESIANEPQLTVELRHERTHPANPLLLRVCVTNTGRNPVRINRVVSEFEDGSLEVGVRLAGPPTLYRQLVKEVEFPLPVPGDLDRYGVAEFQLVKVVNLRFNQSGPWNYSDERWRRLKRIYVEADGKQFDARDPEEWIGRIQKNEF